MNSTPIADATVFIWIDHVRLKRITAWTTSCSFCKDDPALTKSRKAAITVAVEHAKAKHYGYATIKEKR